MYTNHAMDVYESGYGCIRIRLWVYMNQAMDAYEAGCGCIIILQFCCGSEQTFYTRRDKITGNQNQPCLKLNERLDRSCVLITFLVKPLQHLYYFYF